MLILATDNIPPHCYYTRLCQLCVFLSLYLSAPFTIFTPFLNLSDKLLPPPSPPTYEPPSLPLPIDLQILDLIFATDVEAINDGTPALLSLCRLPALVRSPCLVIYLPVLQSSVQISLSRGRCNVIFCLSLSGYACYCCYSRSLGLS